MSQGLMHGQMVENLILGLFNLDFLMDDFEETLKHRHCTEVNFEEIPQWTSVRHGITHESMTEMHDKINEHADDSTSASYAFAEAWAVQEYVAAGVKAAEIARIATHNCANLASIN